jgi:hypothetical protein
MAKQGVDLFLSLPIPVPDPESITFIIIALLAKVTE